MIRMKNMVARFALVLVAIVASGCAATDLKAADGAVSHDRPGFVTGIDDGRLWVFRAGSKEANDYLEKGSKPAKHAVRPGGGPSGMTVRSPRVELIDAYMLSRPGFVTHVEDGRLWVFRADSKEAAAFLEKGSKPAKHAVRPGAGPNGMTVRAPEIEDIDAYLATK